VKKFPDDGAGAIGSYKSISGLRSAVLERKDHAGLRLFETDGLAAQSDTRPIHTVEQNPMQCRTEHSHRRCIRERRRDVETFEYSAITTSKFSVREDAALCDHSIRKSELSQRRNRVGREAERETWLPRSRGPLEDSDSPSGATQRDPGDQAPDARTDDQSRTRHMSFCRGGGSGL
jgi:hypothetical protein